VVEALEVVSEAAWLREAWRSKEKLDEPLEGDSHPSIGLAETMILEHCQSQWRE